MKNIIIALAVSVFAIAAQAAESPECRRTFTPP